MSCRKTRGSSGLYNGPLCALCCCAPYVHLVFISEVKLCSAAFALRATRLMCVRAMQPVLRSGFTSVPSVSSCHKGAVNDTSVPPIAPLRTAPAPATDAALTSAQPWPGLQTTPLPHSYLWAQPEGAFVPQSQMGLGAVMPTLPHGEACDAVAKPLAPAPALQGQLQFAPGSAQQSGGVA